MTHAGGTGTQHAHKRSTLYLILLAGLVIAAGCSLFSGHLFGRKSMSGFSHAVHGEAMGLVCESCHRLQADGAMDYPDKAACIQCHDASEEEALFYAFFEGEKGKWVHVCALAGDVMFSHLMHTEAKGLSCTSCHEETASSDAVYEGSMMKMEACERCHRETAPVSFSCASCHKSMDRETEPESHTKHWLRRHGSYQRLFEGMVTEARCDICHDDSYCEDCHTTVKPRSHTAFWCERGHGTVSGIDRDGCSVCHERTQCDQCHRRIRPRNHTGSFGSPFNRHCMECHLPLNLTEHCGVCHHETPSHEAPAAMPADASHRTMDPASCRSCHLTLSEPRHADNGTSCIYCHY